MFFQTFLQIMGLLRAHIGLQINTTLLVNFSEHSININKEIQKSHVYILLTVCTVLYIYISHHSYNKSQSPFVVIPTWQCILLYIIVYCFASRIMSCKLALSYICSSYVTSKLSDLSLHLFLQAYFHFRSLSSKPSNIKESAAQRQLQHVIERMPT